jgi:hypothetical protein
MDVLAMGSQLIVTALLQKANVFAINLFNEQVASILQFYSRARSVFLPRQKLYQSFLRFIQFKGSCLLNPF